MWIEPDIHLHARRPEDKGLPTTVPPPVEDGLQRGSPAPRPAPGPGFSPSGPAPPLFAAAGGAAGGGGPGAVPAGAQGVGAPHHVAGNGQAHLSTAAAPTCANGYDSDEEDAANAVVRLSSRKVMNQKSVANHCGLEMGAIVTPLGTSPHPAPKLHRKPMRCNGCGAYLNKYCTVTPRTGMWSCNFCGARNSSGSDLAQGDLQSYPELVVKAVDYCLDAGSVSRGPYAGRSEASPLAAGTAPVLFVIDESLGEKELADLRKSLLWVLRSLNPATRIGIATFGATFSVFDLENSGVAAADVVPGDKAPSKAALKTLLYGMGNYLAPAHEKLPILESIVQALRPYNGPRGIPYIDRPRCLGVAVEVGLALLRGVTGAAEAGAQSWGRPAGGRVLIVTSGPPTVGPGSLPTSPDHPQFEFEEANAMAHLAKLADAAAGRGVAVDVLAGGQDAVNVPLLLPLTSRSGGALMLHEEFGEQWMASAAGALHRTGGSDGVLDVRVSPSLRVSRLIGPLEPLPFPSDVVEESGEFSPAAVRMCSVEAKQGCAMCLELAEDLVEDHACVQVVVRYQPSEGMGAVVERVVTRRLGATSSVSHFLASVDAECSALLLAKRAMLEAHRGGAGRVPSVLGAIQGRMTALGARFGRAVEYQGAYYVGGEMQALPRELGSVAEAMYHLCRGPMLGTIAGHVDEREVLQAVFLGAGAELSSLMVTPRLWAWAGGRDFHAWPAADLALWSSTILVLDHGTDIFVWEGLEVALNPELQASGQAVVGDLLRRLVAGRFPAPTVRNFKEASSQSRFMLSRLIPMHKDAPEVQEAHFPPLSGLEPQARESLRARLPRTDEPSYFDWLGSLQTRPPERDPSEAIQCLSL